MSNRVSFRIFTIILMVAVPTAMFAQSGTVAGQVTDVSTGEPLVGANILIVGTNLGAATDINGEYSIGRVPSGDQKVTANYIGYATSSQSVNVLVASVTQVNFELRTSAIDLEEIVVTGIGVAIEKSKVGHSVGSISMNSLENAPVSTVQEILTGREPGVILNLNGGLAGEGSSIRIRGTSSLTQSNQPTIYVDGVRMDNTTNAGGYNWNGGVPSRISEINPDAIEKIELLKGAAASALYGSKATNGIINIITKQGAIGSPKFNFKISKSTNSYDNDRWKPSAGFARDDEQAERMYSVHGKDALGNPSSYKPWQVVEVPFAGMLYDQGQGTLLSGSVSGGAPGATYFANVRYDAYDGPYNSNAKLGGKPVGDASDVNNKFMANATLNLIPTDKVRVRLHSAYTNVVQSTLQNNNNIFGVTSLIQMGKPEFSTENNFTGSFAWGSAREMTYRQLNSTSDNTLVSLSLTYKASKDLNIRGTVGMNMTNGRGEYYNPYGWNVDGKTTYYTDGYLAIGKRSHKEFTLDTKADYSLTMGALSFETVGGFNVQRKVVKFLEGWGNQFPGPGLIVVGATNDPNSTSSFEETIEAGYLVQEQIGFSDYLYTTVSVRLDATSTFGEEFTTVTYPRVGISWLATNMLGQLGPLSTLRLRAGYGKSGNQPGAFDQYTTFKPSASPEGPGLRPDNVGNPDLGPEVTTEIEVGADFGLLNDRIGVEFGYYDKTTKDGLVAQAFPPSGGFTATQLTNIGEWDAKGWELSLDANLMRSKTSIIDIYGTLSYMEDEIISLGGAPEQKVGGAYPRYRNFLTEGFPIAALFGVKLQDVEYPIDIDGDGEADSKAELLAFFDTGESMNLLAGWAPVLAIPTDADVTAKRAKTAGDKLAWYLGKPRPDYMGTIGINVTFMKNFKITSLFEARWGNFGYTNLTDAFRKSNPYIGRNFKGSSTNERDFMTGGVDANYNPQYDPETRLEAAKKWLNTYQSLSPYSGLNLIEDGDFIRWRELSITYSIPTETVRRFGLSSLSFTLAGRNIKLWTDYSGIDPELNAASAIDGGLNMFRESVDAFGVPIPRSFTLTANFGF